MNKEEIQEVLDELHTVRPEMLNEKGKRLFEAIMKIADERDLYKEIIKEVREEVKIYEEQSNDGTTNELDNYVFVQRLKKILDKENI